MLLNFSEKIYDALDSEIMYGVNKGVKAYNVVTGDTRAGLANKLLCVAPVLETVGLGIQHPLAIPLGSLFLLMSHTRQKKNNLQEKLEKKQHNGTLSVELFHYQEDNAYSGPIFLLASGFLSIPKGKESMDNYALGGGYFLRSLSFYIMRSEYVPPRKSIFEKAGDYLEELVEVQQLQRKRA